MYFLLFCQVPDSFPPGLPDALHWRVHPLHLPVQHLHQDLLHHLHPDKHLPGLCQVRGHNLIRSGHIQVTKFLNKENNLKYLRIEFLILGAAVLALLVNHDFNIQEVYIHHHHHCHCHYQHLYHHHHHHHQELIYAGAVDLFSLPWISRHPSAAQLIQQGYDHHQHHNHHVDHHHHNHHHVDHHHYQYSSSIGKITNKGAWHVKPCYKGGWYQFTLSWDKRFSHIFNKNLSDFQPEFQWYSKRISMMPEEKYFFEVIFAPSLCA